MVTSKEFSHEYVLKIGNMGAKRKSVSEIAIALKGSKRGIYQILAWLNISNENPVQEGHE